MISRHWRGWLKAGYDDNAIRYFITVTFPKVSKIPGFLRATILTRPSNGRPEFLIVTEWDSLDAIRQFAGDDVERAVIPDEVAAMMDDYDERALHYEVREHYAPANV